MDRRQLLSTLAAAGLAAGLHARLANQEQERDELELDPDGLGGGEPWTGMSLTEAEREQVARSFPEIRERLELRRGAELPNALAPATVFDPYLGETPPAAGRPAPLAPDTAPELPADAADVAFAPVSWLRAWLDAGELSSVELTELCLERCTRLDATLEAIVTLCPERALAEARAADARIAKGESAPLLGIPYAAKDLFDTAGIATTYGAAPYRDRVPLRDAVAVERLARAGAVLVAKSTLGALAYGDIWFGGRTNCPWDIERGSSGSSAGSCAGVAAGMFPFALGTETYGSIVSPCVRNGATGLRPTFGRVPRTGSMALCWSLDKIGPIVRRVADAAPVLAALAGPDPGDPSSRIATPFRTSSVELSKLRVGYRPEWFEGERGADPAVLEHLRELGCTPVEVELPAGPWASLLTLLMVEAAAAFEELTRSGRDDELTWQDDSAWPNTFRSHWMVPSVEVVQADRLRRRLCEAYRELFRDVDVLVGPPFAADLVLTTNFTGHPCLVLRSAVTEDGPRSICLWGALDGEAGLIRLGSALERRLACWDARPPVS